jgi:hypothetical protein
MTRGEMIGGETSPGEAIGDVRTGEIVCIEFDKLAGVELSAFSFCFSLSFFFLVAVMVPSSVGKGFGFKGPVVSDDDCGTGRRAGNAITKEPVGGNPS